MTLKQRNELITQYIPLANKLAKNKHTKYKNICFDEIRSAAYMGLVDAANKFKNNLNCSFYTYAKIRICGEISDFIKKIRPHKGIITDIQDSNDHVDYYNNIDLLYKSISFLNKKSQKIIKMYYFENKSMKEIGEILDVSESRISQIITEIKKIIRNKMKLYLIAINFALMSICYGQNPIPVPLENIEKISGTNGVFEQSQKTQKTQTELPEKYKDLVWNKLDTKNFIILSIDKNQGNIIKSNIENLKSNIVSKWGLVDFDFSVPCKIICVTNKDLLLDLFKVDVIHYETRKEQNGKIILNAIWLYYDEFKNIEYSLSNVCFDELENIRNKKIPPYIKKGMCYLSKDISVIKKELSDLDSPEINFPQLVSEKEENIKNYEKQSAIACLLFRKEFGQTNFINYLNNNDLSNFGSNDAKIINDILNRYYKNLKSDLQENKVPNSYLNIRRK